MIRDNRFNRVMAWLAMSVILAAPLAVFSQTRIEAPKNKYSVQDDIRAGQQAAQQVRQQMPLIREGSVDNYVESVGRRLVDAIPSEFRHPEFNYTFDVVNARDINAFALPGGPMFVNRGMIEAARREGEMAGVMAHEISHVALRHATAQATETQKFQIGSVLGQILGGVIGGVPGAVIGAGSQIGFGAGALKYSRKYETQADILGAQIMARAGYDPRDLAEMFRTIERQGGGRGGPEWLSSHPNPGNRYERINQEAAQLPVNRTIRDSRDFNAIQAYLRRLSPAPTMAEIARSGQRYPTGESTGDYPGNVSIGRVSYPSSRYRSYNEGFVTVSVPENWREIRESNSVWFAPEGGYGQYQGQAVFTHGVNIGLGQTQSRDLRQATQEFLNNLVQTNRSLQQSGGYGRTTVDGRTALTTSLTNVNEATGQRENIAVLTTQTRNGDLFYMIAVAPQGDARNFNSAFNNIHRSIRLNDY